MILSICLINIANAQNCTVNAGTDNTICLGSSFIQQGNIGGNFTAGSVIWTQTGGPSTATITNANSLSPTLSNFVIGIYTFQISAICQIGGNATDQCVITVTTGATPVTHSNLNIGCYTPGTAINLTGVAIPGHTLSWSVVSNTAPSAGTFNGSSLINFTGDNPTIQFAAPPIGWCGGNVSAVINIKSTNIATGCAVDRFFTITFRFMPVSVFATTSSSSICGTCANLVGSCNQGGTGLWTVISTPAGAPAVIFSPDNTSPSVSVCNLVPGTYTFRWTVSGGACTIGTADVTITVAPSSGPITTPIANSKYFCVGTLPSTVSLEGSFPAASETVTWAQVSGPLVTIINPNNPFAQAVGLTQSGAPYIFSYTISNGSCVKTDTMLIGVTSTFNFSPPLQTWCTFGGQTSISRNIGNIPFMQSDSIEISIIYESGPVSAIEASFRAEMMLPNGTNTGVYHNSNNIPLPLGGIASHVYQSSLLWPSFNQQFVQMLFFMYPSTGATCPNLVPGIYRFRLRYKDHCGTFQSQSFETKIGSIVSFVAGSDQMLPCGANNTTLAGNSVRCEINPFWTTIQKPAAAPDPITLANKYDLNAPLVALQNGTYIFKWGANASGFGCIINSDSVRIVVSVTPPGVPTINGGGTACINQPISISGSLGDDAASGVWTVSSVPAAGLYTLANSPNNPNITFTPNSANTVYTLTWTVQNGCGTALNTTTITTGSTVVVMPDITNTNNCAMAGLFGTLNATPSGGTWTSSSPMYSFTTPLNASTDVVPNAFNNAYPVVFYYTTTSSCGTLRDSVTFSTSGLPLLVRDSFCSIATYPTSQTITLNNIRPNVTYEVTSLSGTGNITVNPMVFTPTGTTFNLNVTVSQSGQYYIQVQKKLGACNPETTSFTLQFSAPPDLAIAGPDINLCGTTNSVTLNALPNPLGTSGGLWSVHTLYNGFAPTFSNTQSPTSTLTFTNGGGEALLKWEVTGDNRFCNGTTADYLRVRYVPTADAGLNQTACYDASGSPISLVLNANNFTAGVGAWSVVSQPSGANATFINPSLQNTTVTNLINGFYTLRWTIVDPLGLCPTTTDEIDITVYYGCIILPINLQLFTAIRENENARIKWSVANESAGDKYILERSVSADGPYQAIASINYDITNNGKYDWLDQSVHRLGASKVYYRIKIISASNTIAYSKIATVKMPFNNFDVFPTVLKKGELINVLAPNAHEDAYQWILFSANGKLIQKAENVKDKTATIRTNNMTSGTYLLQIHSKQATQTHKILIQ